MKKVKRTVKYLPDIDVSQFTAEKELERFIKNKDKILKQIDLPKYELLKKQLEDYIASKIVCPKCDTKMVPIQKLFALLCSNCRVVLEDMSPIKINLGSSNEE